MKFSMMRLLGVGRFIARTFVSISFFIGLGLSTSFAGQLPPGVITVNAGGGLVCCGTNIGPVAANYLEASYDAQRSGYSGTIPYDQQEVSWVTASLGPGMPQVGEIAATAVASDTGAYQASSSAGGWIQFYFSVDQIKVPGEPPMVLPVYFETYGEGSIESGFGRYQVDAALLIPGPGIEYQILYEGNAPQTGTLDKITRVDLQPNTPYAVQIAANAYAFAEPPMGYSQYSEASATVDPIILLDQTDFDDEHPGNSFPLAEYYQIDFSPNVSTPEPSTLYLLCIGFAGLIAYGWRQCRG